MKNIIFLISDQMQRKAVLEDPRCHMENLKALCKDAVDFPASHAVNAICSPARASLITGMLPHNHGMVDCTHTVPDYRSEYNYALKSLPQALKEQGYVQCYYGKWHIERSYRLENFGIDEYETEREIPKRNLTPLSKVTVATEGYRTVTVCGVYQEGEEASEEHYIYDKAMSFIDRQKDSGKPFCVYLSTYAPHDPYVVPAEIYNLYQNTEFPVPENWDNGLEEKPGLYKRLHRVWKDASPEDVSEIIRCYYSCCSLVDHQIGRLVSFLKEHGLYDDTVIVFTSDHGDMVGNHGLFCKGVAPFEDSYRTPCVIKLPGNRNGGETCGVLTDTCDILPTVMEAAEVPRNFAVDGKSLLPYVDGKDYSEVSTLSEFFGQRFSYSQRIVWYKNYKYVFNTFDEDELYDLGKDPGEMENCIDNPAYGEIRKDLCRKMWERVVETGDWSLQDSQYLMHRFAPVGPLSVQGQTSDRFTMFNKSF